MTQIDDYNAAQALTEKIKTNLPIQAHASQEIIKGLQAQGKSIHPNQEFTIQSVFYAGDMGGITCALKSQPEDKEAYAVSITHLKIDPTHPLVPEIQAYQRQRIRRLAIQNSREFAAEALKQRSSNSRKKTAKKLWPLRIKTVWRVLISSAIGIMILPTHIPFTPAILRSAPELKIALVAPNHLDNYPPK
jgi:hypothetical protein